MGGGSRGFFFVCFFAPPPLFNYRPVWKSRLHGGWHTLCAETFLLPESGMDGATVTWPPSTGGGNPGGPAQMCVHSKASEMTGAPGGFPSSCDSGSRPPSLLLTTRGVNLCCLRRRGAREFSSFFFFLMFHFIFKFFKQQMMISWQKKDSLFLKRSCVNSRVRKKTRTPPFLLLFMRGQ